MVDSSTDFGTIAQEGYEFLYPLVSMDVTRPLGITMRLYGPKASILQGAWAPPPLTKSA